MKRFLNITIPLLIFSFGIFSMQHQSARLGIKIARGVVRKIPSKSIYKTSKKFYRIKTPARKPITNKKYSFKTTKRNYSQQSRNDKLNLNLIHPRPREHAWLNQGGLGRAFRASWGNIKSGISKRLVPLKKVGKALHSELKQMPGYSTIKKGYGIWEKASFWVLRRIPGFKYLERKLGSWGAYAVFGTLKKAALLSAGPTVAAYLKNKQEKEFLDLFEKIVRWDQKKLNENKETLLNLVNTEKWLDVTKEIKHLLTTENGVNLLVTIAEKYGDDEINWNFIISKISRHFKSFNKVAVNDRLVDHIYSLKKDDKIQEKFTNLFITRLEGNPPTVSAELLKAVLKYKAQEILTSRKDKNNYYIIQSLKPHQKKSSEINDFIIKLEELPEHTRKKPWGPKKIIFIPS